MALIEFSGSFPIKVKEDVIALLDNTHKYKCKNYNKRSCDISGHTFLKNWAKILLFYMYSSTSYMTMNNTRDFTEAEQEELNTIHTLRLMLQYRDSPQYVYPARMSKVEQQKQITKLTKTKEYLNRIAPSTFDENTCIAQILNERIQADLDYLTTIQTY